MGKKNSAKTRRVNADLENARSHDTPSCNSTYVTCRRSHSEREVSLYSLYCGEHFRQHSCCNMTIINYVEFDAAIRNARFLALAKTIMFSAQSCDATVSFTFFCMLVAIQHASCTSIWSSEDVSTQSVIDSRSRTTGCCIEW